MSGRVWTCRRVTKGVKCGTVNPRVRRKCQTCGKPRPAVRKPAHMSALADPYDVWVERYGNVCGICGKAPSARRRLDRDHDHATGAARGVLCSRCNRYLPYFATSAWLRAAADYLERSAA